jgi:hypothetical protein
MSVKTLIFNFDGTGSEPRDAEQFSADHFKEDSSISNILKLHLLFGGTLKNSPTTVFKHQLSFYYHGIGVKGSRLKRFLNQKTPLKNDDVSDILRHALLDFKTHYKPGDTVLLTGFSRGAALARRFAKCLEPLITNNVYVCVFETIASIGLSKVNRTTRGAEHVIFENHTLATNVVCALHCLALDEKRRAFEPTLMNQQSNITEVWFAGAHSDIGGGYYRDGLSDICLRYALEWLLKLPINIAVLSSNAIDYTTLHPNQHLIAQDDVTIIPDPVALSHQQHYFWFNSFFKLVDRRCYTLSNDQHSELLPTIHDSVATRINALTSYRPESLKSAQYKIVYSDNQTLNFTGLSPHIEFDNHNIHVLTVGQSHDVFVFACQEYNSTGLMCIKGGCYSFEPYPEQYWFDNGIKCSPLGWHRKNITLGVKALPVSDLTPFKRLPQANWFSLIGTLNNNDHHAFEIAEGASVTMNESGEFTPFANDIKRFYGLNNGSIKVKVTRLR